MAGTSGQNFLNLLFGGLDEGINNFTRGQERGQDLALNLHQMRAQQANADRAFDFNVEGRAENTRRYEQGVARDSALNFEKKNTVFQDRARQAQMDAFARQGQKENSALTRARTRYTNAQAAAVATKVGKFTVQQKLTLRKEYTKGRQDYLAYRNMLDRVPEEDQNMIPPAPYFPANFETYLQQSQDMVNNSNVVKASQQNYQGMSNEELNRLAGE